MPRNARWPVSGHLSPHVRPQPVGADQGAAPHHLARSQPGGDRQAILIVAGDLGIGAQFDQGMIFAPLQEYAVQIAAMHDGVGIAEAGAKPVAEIDVADLAVGQRIHQPQPIDIDRHAARRLADAEPVETVEGVGAELDAGANLAEAARLLQHLRGDALLGERQRRRESADAAAGDEDPIGGHR